MSEPSDNLPDNRANLPAGRCPNCDSVIAVTDSHCLMCGQKLQHDETPESVEEHLQSSDRLASSAVPADRAAGDAPDVIVSFMKERQSPVSFWLTAIFVVFIIVLGALVLRYQDPNVSLALVQTATPIPPTPTYTPTWTPLATEAFAATVTPVSSFTPPPSETPLPPRPHQVTQGETLIGLALRYQVSVESIAGLNNFAPDTQIRVGQQLQVPWPTATPPLVAVAVTVRGVNVVADPTDCERYEVRGGDTISKIAAVHDVELELFMMVNRLTEDTILRPGDSLCVPEIIVGGNLPPTPGPSPTITPTSLPAAPRLLYPVQNSVVESLDETITLQWTAVKNLSDSEWYMVELVDIDEVDALPRRGFTRDTAFRVPVRWRPTEQAMHRFQWRVSIVRVTGTRQDGNKIYTYGGANSAEALFSWMGAVPTATPTATPTSTPTP